MNRIQIAKALAAANIPATVQNNKRVTVSVADSDGDIDRAASFEAAEHALTLLGWDSYTVVGWGGIEIRKSRSISVNR